MLHPTGPMLMENFFDDKKKSDIELKLETLDLPKDKVVAILDNQPRNKDVCKILDKVIDKQYKVVIWPQSLDQKDINDMVLAGKDPLDVVKKHIYQGLEAKIKFTEWKRC